ncbi:hypothetical protein BDW59DRAFT_175201 [Aspergillus cavernicola]|uniref:Uncharacterized protein n=1 Tax=Aspergillus cavernicola TaxID=176166 RepID=A0ABR4HS66_9EURO
MSHNLLQNTHTDHAIDNLLLLTQNATLHLDKKTITNFQKLAEFCVQLWQLLNDMPDNLGLNLAPSIIIAAIISSELLAVTALSICVNKFNRDLGDLLLVLAYSTTLKQLCFLQRPDRNSNNASARFCTLLLLQGCSLGDLGWLRNKTIYPTCAFSTSLRSREFLTLSSTISGAQIFPLIHMFTFMNHQREDAPDIAADHHVQQYQNSSSYSYSDYYAMENTLLDAGRFAVRFLAYLRTLGSGSESDKAILRFAYKGASSSLTTTTTVDDDDHSPPPWSLPGQSAVSPISARFFDYKLAPNNPTRVRVRDIPPGSWVVLVDQRGRSCSSSDDNNVFLQYSFVKICQTSAEIVPEQQQQRPVPVPNLAEVVGGLTNFLRETAPGSNVSTWEEQVKEVERDLRTRPASIETGKRCIGICVMAESSAHTLLNQLL